MPDDRLDHLLAAKLQVVQCARYLESIGLVNSADKLRWVAAAIQGEIGAEERRLVASAPPS